MDMIQKIHEAGIVGAGGAGFPTDVKLNCKVEYFIVNGLECEPLIQSDKYIMRNMSEKIIKMTEEVGDHVGASYIYIGLKDEYEKEKKALEDAITKLDSKVKLKFLKSFYPAGDEQVLVYELTGRVVPPGEIPLKVGAVVTNVNTLLNIYEAVYEDKAVIYKYVTVIGEVNNPSIIKVPIGTSVEKCIEAAGGAKTEDYGVIMGGPMMGRKFSKEEVASRYIKKTDGGIIVLSRKHYVLARESLSIEAIKKQAASACIQCQCCTEMCPRHLLGHDINPHKIMRSIALGTYNDDILKEALICSECGVCEIYACPMMLSPKRMNIYIKGLMREKGIRWSNKNTDFKPSTLRDFRKVPTHRLIGRLNLQKYYDQKLECGKPIIPNKVEIYLSQHIGSPSEPIVQVNDDVIKNQLIATHREGKIGANIHASIDGIVTYVDDTKIVINGKETEVIL